MNIYTNLARETLEKYLSKKELPDKENFPSELLNKSSCFVSLHEKESDELKGCIGTISPVYKNLGSEIIANTISAAQNDPRFNPLKYNDLNNIKISVDVLEKPEQIESKNDLDPKKYGVIVKSHDGRSGLLLPNLDGINDAQNQVDIACEKAGIEPNEDIYLYRFKSTRYNE